MVYSGYEGIEAAAQEVAYQGHYGLGTAEPKTGYHHVLEFQLLNRQSLANGYGEGVHGQAHGNEKQFDKAQIHLPPQQFRRQGQKRRDLSAAADKSRRLR